jgi:hypothetical protein
MKIALDRITDPIHPSDRILLHLLAVREVDHKRVIEHRQPDRGEMETHNMIPFDKLSIETRRLIVAELEECERAEKLSSAVRG